MYYSELLPEELTEEQRRYAEWELAQQPPPPSSERRNRWLIWVAAAGLGGLYFDTRANRYLSPATIRIELDTYTDNTEGVVRFLAQQLRNGEISLADWQLAMRREIKRVHLTSIAMERGGWANMTAADYGRAGQIIRTQYGYLDGFAAQIADGTQRLDGTLESRSALYSQAGRNSFYRSFHANLPDSVGWVRSLRTVTDSCTECIALHGRWFRIGDPAYKLPGARICLHNCRCHEQFGRDVDGALQPIEVLV